MALEAAFASFAALDRLQVRLDQVRFDTRDLPFLIGQAEPHYSRFHGPDFISATYYGWATARPGDCRQAWCQARMGAIIPCARPIRRDCVMSAMIPWQR